MRMEPDQSDARIHLIGGVPTTMTLTWWASDWLGKKSCGGPSAASSC